MFLLDIGLLKGLTALREKLNSSFPKLDIWSLTDRRQLDLSSCTTDTMVMLKDGLRLTPSLTTRAKEKLVKREADINIFNLPEELLKTAQSDSFLPRFHADPSRVIPVHTVRGEDGKRFKVADRVVTLSEYREIYAVPNEVDVPIYPEGYTPVSQPKPKPTNWI